MGVGIPQSGVIGARRTLGSLAPHPASIGRIAGAHLGIKTPRMHFATGGITGNRQKNPPIDITDTMFSPIDPLVGVPDVGTNFIQSPQLQTGHGAPAPPAVQQQQQQDPMKQISEGTSAANGATDLYNKFFPAKAATPVGIVSNASNIGSAGDVAANLGTDFSGYTSAASMAAPAVASTAAADAAATTAASTMPEWLTALMAFFNKGGAVPEARAAGGKVGETYHESGLLNSAGPGRTDTINTNVPAGAYVVPADVVSGLGEGNTLAGSAVIDRMFATAPYAVAQPRIRHGAGAPRPPAVVHNPTDDPSPTVDTSFINSAGRADGGGVVNIVSPTASWSGTPNTTQAPQGGLPVSPSSSGLGGVGGGTKTASNDTYWGNNPNVPKEQQNNAAYQPFDYTGFNRGVDPGLKRAKGGDTGKAPVVVAGGEHVISPKQIIAKFGSLRRGHKILDHWIVLQRQKIAEEMMKLAPPVGSRVKKK